MLFGFGSCPKTRLDGIIFPKSRLEKGVKFSFHLDGIIGNILEMGWKWIIQDSFRRFLIAEAIMIQGWPLWGRKLHPLKVNKKRFCFWYPILQGEISRSDLTVGSLKVQKGKSGKINTNKNGKTQEKLAFKKHFQHSRLCTVDTACAHACKIWVKETETTTCKSPSIFHRHVINWIKKQQQKIPKKTLINMYPPKKINHSNLYQKKNFIPFFSHPRISSTFTFSASNAKALVLGPIGAKSELSVSELRPPRVLLRVMWSSFFSSSSNLGVMWRVGGLGWMCVSWLVVVEDGVFLMCFCVFL